MEKTKKMTVVERFTPLSKNTYYFTENQIFRLESYSNMIYYFLLLCTVLLIFESLSGTSYFAVLIACALIAFILAFMILWVYPKERRMSHFSFAEIMQEPSAKKVPWSSVTKIKLGGNQVAFWEDGNQRYGLLRSNPQDAIKLFKSKLGKPSRQKKWD